MQLMRPKMEEFKEQMQNGYTEIKRSLLTCQEDYATVLLEARRAMYTPTSAPRPCHSLFIFIDIFLEYTDFFQRKNSIGIFDCGAGLSFRRSLTRITVAPGNIYES